MNAILLELYRHKTWATERLLEACAGLPDEVLDSTTPGTFGTIRQTLHHLVGAEEGYLALVTGEKPVDPLGDEPVAIDDLVRRIRELGPKWELLAAEESGERERDTGDGWHITSAVPMAQAIHHADDHRSHVLSILGARGVTVPGLDIGEDLDVWHHAIAVGLMTKPENPQQ